MRAAEDGGRGRWRQLHEFLRTSANGIASLLRLVFDTAAVLNLQTLLFVSIPSSTNGLINID